MPAVRSSKIGAQKSRTNIAKPKTACEGCCAAHTACDADTMQLNHDALKTGRDFLWQRCSCCIRRKRLCWPQAKLAQSLTSSPWKFVQTSSFDVWITFIQEQTPAATCDDGHSSDTETIRAYAGYSGSTTSCPSSSSPPTPPAPLDPIGGIPQLLAAARSLDAAEGLVGMSFSKDGKYSHITAPAFGKLSL
ncbi:hypothetical protein DL93DRAFT_2096845 [Clavulina sp. PMI_390]|nr:hypothetical protein DL93DRAFT_2096845 [Clavulina sp. PMI_390]